MNKSVLAVALACLTASASQATFVTYHIGTASSGQFGCRTCPSAIFQHQNYLGSYEITLDLSVLGNAGYFQNSISTPSGNIAFDFVPEHNYIGFRLLDQIQSVIGITLQPETLAQGFTANIVTGSIVSSSVSVNNQVLLNAGVSLDGPPVIYDLSTRFSETGIVGATNSLFSKAFNVPEPATWVMMVLGFGLIGAAMRRRKVAVGFA